MLSVRLSQDMQLRIERLAKATKRPKSFFVKEALERYMEDLEDYFDVLNRQNSKDRELITFDELKEALSVQNSH
ncbi:MAG: ribbon-helix-helix protein, CopG family [Epsilonproteobacteria bacterium]|nr:ribbon-helix-helix protein, CopG family [Campylobacterota bacterium]MBD3839793.1 ribbon-helix-helix protein, CopG family [Campylobacterota bacterium]TQV64301.1 MAG: ribbon-helix-helix protein, CopG family [Sulfurovum sp.]